MSESGYFKIELTTEHPEPELELNYLLTASWDVFQLELIQSEDACPDNCESECSKNYFNLIIFELSHEESIPILEEVKAKAALNGAELLFKPVFEFKET